MKFRKDLEVIEENYIEDGCDDADRAVENDDDNEDNNTIKILTVRKIIIIILITIVTTIMKIKLIELMRYTMVTIVIDATNDYDVINNAIINHDNNTYNNKPITTPTQKFNPSPQKKSKKNKSGNLRP